MKRNIRLFLVLLLTISLSFCLYDIVQAKERGSYGGYRGYKTYHPPSLKIYKSPPLKTYKANSYKTYSPRNLQKAYNLNTFSNKPERSPTKKREFLKSSGYERNPPGYEVDHIVPLSKGGADEPYNMQLLPKEVHKQKTKMDLKK